MTAEQSKPPFRPYGDGVYRKIEKPDTRWESVQNSIHRMCEPMFAHVKKISEGGLKVTVLSIIQEINRATQRIVFFVEKGKNITDQQMFIEAQVVALKNIDEEFLLQAEEQDKKYLAELTKYTEETFLNYIRNLPVIK